MMKKDWWLFFLPPIVAKTLNLIYLDTEIIHIIFNAEELCV